VLHDAEAEYQSALISRFYRKPIAVAVHYGNISILELTEQPELKRENLSRLKPVELPSSDLDRYYGPYLVNSKPDAPKATIAHE
jgi:hypothetical protein